MSVSFRKWLEGHRPAVELEVDGETYEVVPAAPRKPPGVGSKKANSDKLREALVKYAGSWADMDADKVIADLYRAREERSRPADRP